MAIGELSNKRVSTFEFKNTNIRIYGHPTAHDDINISDNGSQRDRR